MICDAYSSVFKFERFSVGLGRWGRRVAPRRLLACGYQGTGDRAGGRPPARSMTRSKQSHRQQQQQQTCGRNPPVSVNQILVRSLTGRTGRFRHSHSWARWDGLIADQSWVTGWLLLHYSRRTKNGSRQQCLHPGDCLQVVGRLLGGAGQQQVYFPGQWTCMSCGMEVCWPSKFRCFRCLAPKPFGTGADSSQPFFGKGQPRERAHPGRVPAVNPTVRPGRKLPPQAPMPPGPVALEATPTVNMVDATAIARVFRMLSRLGVSDALLQQGKSSIPPPSASKPKNGSA